MRKDDNPLRIPLDQIDSMRIEGQNLVVEKKKSKRMEPTKEMRRIRTNRWWNIHMSMAFMAKVEIWVNEEAAEMDAQAGGTNELIGHNMAEDTADGIIIEKLRSSKGHLRDIDLIDRAGIELFRIERQKNQPEGSYTPFGLKFIDMLGIAKDLSETRIERLKRDYRAQWAA